jgi:hypothetical protein
MRWQPQSSTDKRFLGMTLTMTMRLGLPGVDRGGYGVDQRVRWRFPLELLLSHMSGWTARWLERRGLTEYETTPDGSGRDGTSSFV